MAQQIHNVNCRIQITKEVEELQGQLQQAALNLDQLNMTSKDYGENYAFISVCVYLVSLVHRKEIARGRGTPQDTKGT